jgi:hypothetical protein
VVGQERGDISGHPVREPKLRVTRENGRPFFAPNLRVKIGQYQKNESFYLDRFLAGRSSELGTTCAILCTGLGLPG